MLKIAKIFNTSGSTKWSVPLPCIQMLDKLEDKMLLDCILEDCRTWAKLRPNTVTIFKYDSETLSDRRNIHVKKYNSDILSDVIINSIFEYANVIEGEISVILMAKYCDVTDRGCISCILVINEKRNIELTKFTGVIDKIFNGISFNINLN